MKAKSREQALQGVFKESQAFSLLSHCLLGMRWGISLQNISSPIHGLLLRSRMAMDKTRAAQVYRNDDRMSLFDEPHPWLAHTRHMAKSLGCPRP